MISSDFITEDIDKYMEIIRRDCSQFLKESNGVSIYRGMNSDEEFMKKKPRNVKRTPIDLPQKYHDAINLHFLDEYGRMFRNGVFGTGNYNDAGYYGRVYAIYPVDRYQYLWSPQISDLLSMYQYYAGDILSTITPDSFVRDIADEYKYRMTDLPRAINSGKEIMIYCKHYYAIRADLSNEK